METHTWNINSMMGSIIANSYQLPKMSNSHMMVIMGM